VNKAALTKRLESQRDATQKTIDEFQKELAKDPMYALNWAGKVYAAAAQNWVARAALEIMSHAEEEEIVKILTRYFTEKALRQARFPSRSTSPWSNEMEREIASASAEFVEALSWRTI
jgi:hypothetical protein